MSVARLWLPALVLALIPPMPASAQDPPRDLAEGTHIFRRLLHQAGCQPLRGPEDLSGEVSDKVLIVLGDTSVLDELPGGLSRLIAGGGSALIATDRRWMPQTQPRVGVSGARVIATQARSMYRDQSDCVFVNATPAGKELFGTGLPVLTSIGSSIPTGDVQLELPPLAVYPPDCRTQGRGPGGPAGRTYCFAAGRVWPWGGRELVLADHSVFINALLFQQDNGNLDFTMRCIDWLTDHGKKKQVLFADDGVYQKEFDIPFKELPMPPLPPPEALVRAVDRGLQGLEEENRFNKELERGLLNIDFRKFLQGLVIFGTLALALYGLVRLSSARQRHEPKVPLLADAAPVPDKTAGWLEMRHRAMQEEHNYWEAARSLARQGLEAVFGSELVLGAAPPSLPRLDVKGSWRQRRQLRRLVTRLWDLAYGERPIHVSSRKLASLAAEIETVRTEVASGNLAIGS